MCVVMMYVFASQLWCVETLEACPMEDTGSLATELEVKSLTTVTVGTIYLEMRRGLVRVMDLEPHGVDPLLAVNVSWVWVWVEERRRVFRLVGVSVDEWAGLHMSG